MPRRDPQRECRSLLSPRGPQGLGRTTRLGAVRLLLTLQDLPTAGGDLHDSLLYDRQSLLDFDYQSGQQHERPGELLTLAVQGVHDALQRAGPGGEFGRHVHDVGEARRRFAHALPGRGLLRYRGLELLLVLILPGNQPRDASIQMLEVLAELLVDFRVEVPYHDR